MNSTTDRGLEPKVIRAFLLIKEITQAQLARELNVTEGFISQVIDRKSWSVRSRDHIASRLGFPYEALWGARPGRKAA